MKKRLLLLLLLPPAQPDSAEEPFWNFNWKHFPPRLPEKGRGRGSPPTPPPVRDSSEQLQSCSFLSRRMKGRETRGESGGAAGLVGKLKARTGRGLHPPAQAGSRGKGDTGKGTGPCAWCLGPPLHITFRGAWCRRCAAGARPQIPAYLPAPPKNPHQGLPRLPSEGLLGSSSVFLKGCKWQLSHPSPAQPPRLRCYSCPNAATQRPPRQRGCGLRSAPPGCS